jgi:peptidoglycan/LPS O-acetylase OafA/YrhL
MSWRSSSNATIALASRLPGELAVAYRGRPEPALTELIQPHVRTQALPSGLTHETSGRYAPRMAARERISSLDGLRGLAAAIVAFSHFSNRTNLLDRLFGQGGGQIGVMLFFCLSGYLMGSLYLRSPCSGEAVFAFARRRFARIGPLFLLVLASCALWALITGASWPFFDVSLGNGLGLNHSVLWTIPVEVQFYAVFPLLWFLFRQSNKAFILVIVAVVIATETVPLAAAPFWPFFNLFFLAGLCIALAPKSQSIVADMVFILCLVLYLLSYPKILNAVFGIVTVEDDDSPMTLWCLPGYLALVSALVWSAANTRAAELLLGNQPMVFLGNISYSIYLLHRPILDALSADSVLMENKIFFFFLFAGLTITTATLSFRFIELPMRLAINRMNISRAKLTFAT